MKVAFYVLFTLCWFSANGQIVNGDFEHWHTDSAGTEKLDNWKHYTDNRDKSNAGFMGGTWRVSNAQSGSSALKISRWYASPVDNVRQSASISQKPGALTGYYIYEDPNLIVNGTTNHVSDTALAIVHITRWDAMLQRRDTLGSGIKKLSEINSYSPFSVPVNYTSNANPDSIFIALFPSSYPDTSNHFVCHDLGNCSYLTIDNLQLQESASVITTGIPGKVLELFPNPASAKVFLRFNGDNKISVQLVNLFGQIVRKMSLINGLNTMDIEDLTGGAYFMEIGSQRYKLLKL